VSASAEPRTAISVLLDAAAPTVAEARYELDPAARRRIELHVTLLFPFVPRRAVTPTLVGELRAFFADRPRPSFDLARVDVFPGVIAYAAPEPAEPLRRLIDDLAAVYPETPPYGGAHADPVPHATLAPVGDDGGAAARALVEPLLPVRCEPTHASLVEEFEPDRWRQLEPLAFGAAA
jgi:2'-5' RNA ligase